LLQFLCPVRPASDSGVLGKKTFKALRLKLGSDYWLLP
jgi:hypothetical protein